MKPKRVLTLYRQDGFWWHRRERPGTERRTPFAAEVDGQALARGYAEADERLVVVVDEQPHEPDSAES